MRLALLPVLLLATTLIVGGSPGAPTTIACGTPFSCTPANFTAPTGFPIAAITLGAPLGGLFALAASFDVANLGCLSLGLPGLVNNVILNPGSIVTLMVGVCSMSDNGRCNGGSPGPLLLFTIPAGFPSGSLAFQVVQSTPLSAGGTGLALSNAVVMNW